MRANASGRYSAVLIPESTDDQPNHPATGPSKARWDFDLEQPARLLGTVLVITQIILNLRQRKKTQSA